MIKAKVICDSISSANNRLTTFVITYPRIILAELNTHKMLSKNTCSSRSVPSIKMIKDVEENPFIPLYWGKNQKGMQAEKEITKEEAKEAETIWLSARDMAVEQAKKLAELGLHKQIANRLLEPWYWTTTIITGTDWENFFALRAHKDAQPEFCILANKMLEQYNKSDPKPLNQGEWHTPFADKYVDNLTIEQRLKVSTARCARVSYVNFDGDIDHQKDYDLHDSLLASGHMSPFEHCGTPLAYSAHEYSGNLYGWFQYRKKFKNGRAVGNDENRSDSRVIKKYFAVPAEVSVNG